MERLQEKYNKEIVPALKEKFKFNNVMQAPRILKIVLNVGLGKIKDDKKKIDDKRQLLTELSLESIKYFTDMLVASSH